MNNRIKIYVLLIAAVLLLSACNTKAATVQPTQAPQPTQAGYPAPDQASTSPTDYPAPPLAVPAITEIGYPAPGTFKLTLADGSFISVAVDTLNALPKEKVSFDGTELEVLALVDALKQSGVETYNQIIVSGSGSILTLTKDKVAQSYLQLFPDGTIRVAIQGQPQNAWIVALTTMKVE